jgi:TonB family protein
VVVIALHLLLALAMLTARLQVDGPFESHTSLLAVEPPPARQAPPRTLPGAPRASLRPVVVPVPEVVVDRTDAVAASPMEALPAPAAAEAVVAAPPVGAPVVPVVAGQGSGVGIGTGAGAGRPDARPARVFANAPQCQPDYPPVARMHNVGGTTRLRFTVDMAGHIVGVRVLGHSGQQPENSVLDIAAAEALSHCPAEVGIDDAGRPVGGTADINYHWVLN